MDLQEIIELSEGNISSEGCYCLRSKPNSSGYQGKKNWLGSSFDKGMKYVKLLENGKQAGFIEYVQIEHSSRVIYGENYIVIHCLWIGAVGKGYASALIQHCLEDARRQHKAGVVVITNAETSWTPSKDIFIKNHFIEIDNAPYGFELLVHTFYDAAPPYFPQNWEERLRFQDLTILQTQQCPYLDIATQNLLEAAAKLGLQATIIDLTSRAQLLELSPTPYGVYGAVFRKDLISYHRLTVHSAMKRLKKSLLLKGK